MTDQYETERYWAGVRTRRDGRVNAWGAGLDSLQNTLDRHLFGYSSTNPYLNFPTNSNIIKQTGQFGLTFLAR